MRGLMDSMNGDFITLLANYPPAHDYPALISSSVISSTLILISFIFALDSTYIFIHFSVYLIFISIDAFETL